MLDDLTLNEEEVQDAVVEVDTRSGVGYQYEGGNSQNLAGGFLNDSEGDDDDDDDQTRLYQILEQAAPRPDDAEARLSLTEIARKKDLIEVTWDLVRKWLRNHQDEETRASAASVRGQADATPLHMVCKLPNPPADVVQSLVNSATETAQWTDSHGWLPLHHACANGASGEVLNILTEVYPEGKTKQDNQFRTPLHFYVTRRTENTDVMAENVGSLSNSGAAELPDRGGMLPMHYACAYGTNAAVLEVLAKAYNESLTTRENKGRTPMHLAMVNAHRSASPGVIRFLLLSSGSDAVNMRDSLGYLPLHLLAAGLKGIKVDEQNPRQNVSDCLSMYLDAKPLATADFLTALQDLPDWLQDVAVVSPHVRSLLNEKIVQRFHTAILMLDFYMYFLVIICFELASQTAIDHKFCKGVCPDYQPRMSLIVCLFVGAIYFSLRELIQIVSLFTLNSLSSWFTEFTNLIDLLVVVTVLIYTALMTTGDYEIVDKEQFRLGVATTKLILWIAIISFLKSTSVEFAVFVSGLLYVLKSLVYFLTAVAVILFAFAQMFFIIYYKGPMCGETKPGDSEPSSSPSSAPSFEDAVMEHPCAFPHCEYRYSLLKVYTMMMGEIGDETRYETEIVAQLLYVLYAFLVVILLSNVLIAIVTDSYEIIQNDRAAIEFWSNRLDYVAELDAISYGVEQKSCCIFKRRGAPGAPTDVQESPTGPPIAADEEHGKQTGKEFLRELWTQLMLLFNSNLYDDIDMRPSSIEFWFYIFFRVMAVVFIIPIWLLLGLVTIGFLWPPQVREYLFVQTETRLTRAEREKQKLDQLKVIQTEMNTLKTEIKEEMAGDRDQLAVLKMDVDTIQSEIQSDLQQVRELMTTLLDMGRPHGG